MLFGFYFFVVFLSAKCLVTRSLLHTSAVYTQWTHTHTPSAEFVNIHDKVDIMTPKLRQYCFGLSILGELLLLLLLVVVCYRINGENRPITKTSHTLI